MQKQDLCVDRKRINRIYADYLYDFAFIYVTRGGYAGIIKGGAKLLMRVAGKKFLAHPWGSKGNTRKNINLDFDLILHKI